MKSFAVLSSVLFGAASVFGAPLTERAEAPTEFDITKFSANTIPHGTGAL
ncbi:hypothetical protein PC116_g33775 [Phytophthora cactorum]|nr:hypothetical protein PC116_g33775 [Phytophthora cactorum]